MKKRFIKSSILLFIVVMAMVSASCSNANHSSDNDKGASNSKDSSSASEITDKVQENVKDNLMTSFPHRQTIAAGNGISLGITNDTNEVREWTDILHYK